MKLTAFQKIYLTAKRGFDIAASLAGLIILSPMLLILSLWVIIDDGFPIFFTQKRVGKSKPDGSKTYFKIYKFRTMKKDTPHDMPTHLLSDPEQYLTKSGKWLRKTSMDEIPQLFNILNGDMSVIGPRPALWNQYDLLEERDKYHANDIRPGLTGWAQVNGRDELEIDVKAKLDGYYVEHMGPVMDIRCFLKTVSSVLKSEGVVEGGTGELHKKKRKILIITNHSYMLYQFRKELIEELQKENEVVLSMPFVGHEEDFMQMGLRCINTEIDRRGINPKTDFKLLRTYDKMLKTEKPDLVITYSIKPNVYAGIACTKRNIPFFANVQGLGTAFQKPVLTQFVTALYKFAFRKVEKVYFENEVNAAEFVKRGILKKEKEVILHGAGVNLDSYAYQPYPQNNEVPRFLYLGRIMKEKGMDELFYAVQRLHNEGYQFKLDLVGFFEDEYKEQVEKLEKDGIATFYGFQDNPRPYYAAADCVVLPSYHEGMSNVLLEAAATGRVIITSNIPGCREALEHGKSGILCKVKNKESLYKAMKKFLSLTPAQREAMGKNGRRKMEKEFAKEEIVRETIEALELD